MGYRHRQTGWLHHLLYAVGGVMVVSAWFVRADPAPSIILLCTGVVIVLFAPAFHHMTVEDEVDCLAIRYGPLPIFRKRIPYAAITNVQPDRSSVIDGWGIHYVPLRGWTYNLSGLDCVKLDLGSKVIRVGSDDVDNLVTFLRAKIQPANGFFGNEPDNTAPG